MVNEHEKTITISSSGGSPLALRIDPDSTIVAFGDTRKHEFERLGLDKLFLPIFTVLKDHGLVLDVPGITSVVNSKGEWRWESEVFRSNMSSTEIREHEEMCKYRVPLQFTVDRYGWKMSLSYKEVVKWEKDSEFVGVNDAMDDCCGAILARYQEQFGESFSLNPFKIENNGIFQYPVTSCSGKLVLDGGREGMLTMMKELVSSIEILAKTPIALLGNLMSLAEKEYNSGSTVIFDRENIEKWIWFTPGYTIPECLFKDGFEGGHVN